MLVASVALAILVAAVRPAGRERTDGAAVLTARSRTLSPERLLHHDRFDADDADSGTRIVTVDVDEVTDGTIALVRNT